MRRKRSTGCVRDTIHGCCVANAMIKAVNAEKPKQKSKRGKALKHHDSHNEPKHKRNTHYTDSPNGPRPEHGSPRSHHYQTGGSSTATNFQSPYASSSNNYGRVIENQPAYNSAPYGGGLANAGAPSQSLGYSHAAPAPTPYSNYYAGAPSQSLGYLLAAPAPTPYSNSQAGVPSQSFGNPYTAPAPTPHSGYHAGSSDREGERRSTRPRETSGSTSTNQRPPGPRGPGGRDDVYS